ITTPAISMSSSLSLAARSDWAWRERQFLAYPQTGSSPYPTSSASTRTCRSVSPSRIRSPVVGPNWRAYSARASFTVPPDSLGLQPGHADQLDFLGLAGVPANGEPGRQRQPAAVSGVPVELQPRIDPPEREVRGDPDRPGRGVAHEEPPVLEVAVQLYFAVLHTDRPRPACVPGSPLPRLAQDDEPGPVAQQDLQADLLDQVGHPRHQ